MNNMLYTTQQYNHIDVLDDFKRGAGGTLSHNEGYFGSQEGFCTVQK